MEHTVEELNWGATVLGYMGNEKTRFTLRLDQDLKDEMNRLDVNWSQYLRNAIKERIGEDKHRTVQKLVDSYRESLPKLWVLHMFSYGIRKQYVYETAELVLEGMSLAEGHDSTDEVVDEVHNDLKNRGLDSMYERIEGSDVRTGMAIRGEIAERTPSSFEERVRERIDKPREESELEAGVRTLALFLWNRFDEERVTIIPDGVERTWNLAVEAKDASIDIDDLLRAGLLYKDYYRSNAYGHTQYRVPDYALSVLEQLTDEHSIVNRDEMHDAVVETIKEDSDFKEFIDWMDGRVKLVTTYNEEEEIEEQLVEGEIDLTPDKFHNVRRELVQKGILVIDVIPHRRAAGSRSSRPEKYKYKLTDPALVSLEVLL